MNVKFITNLFTLKKRKLYRRVDISKEVYIKPLRIVDFNYSIDSSFESSIHKINLMQNNIKDSLSQCTRVAYDKTI